MTGQTFPPSPAQLKQTDCPYRATHPDKSWEMTSQWCEPHQRWECSWHLNWCEDHHRYDCHDKDRAAAFRQWLVRERYLSR